MSFHRFFACVLIAFALPISAASAKGESAYVVSGEASLSFQGGEVVEWAVAVAGDPATTEATGTFSLHEFGPDFDLRLVGAVDCLTVAGSTAYFSGVLTESNRADIPVGTPFYSAITDGGATGPDVVAPMYLNPGVTCSPPSFQPEFVVTSGDFQIRFCDKFKENGKCKTPNT